MATEIPKQPIIMDLPEAPTRKTARPDFVEKADDFVRSQQPWGKRINEVAEWMRGIGTLVLQYANESEDWHTQTKTEAERAVNASLQAANYANKTEDDRNHIQTLIDAFSGELSLPTLVGNAGKVLTVNQNETAAIWQPTAQVVQIVDLVVPETTRPDTDVVFVMSARALLPDVDLSHFIVTVGNRPRARVDATNSEVVTYTYDGKHKEGQAVAWAVTAYDKMGNAAPTRMGELGYTEDAEIIKTPSIVSPEDGSEVGETPTIILSDFDSGTFNDTHVETEVIFYDLDMEVLRVVRKATGDLNQIDTPSGIFEESKSYYVTARQRGALYGWSHMSGAIRLDTKDRFALIYGVALVAEGGNGGTLVHLNETGDVISLNKGDFDAHPVWGSIEDVRIDDQYMIKIPKFYVKYEERIVPPAVSPLPCWYISDELVDGFELYPAFYSDGAEIDQIYIGKYQASLASGKLRSVPGVLPVVSRSITQFKSYAEARNVSGVTGFMLWSLYQWSAIQWLYLVENATFNSQENTGQGRVNASSAANVDAADVAQATYRGMVGLWGNVRQWMDGLKTGGGTIQVWDRIGNKTWIDTGKRRTASAGSIYPLSLMKASSVSYDFKDFFIGDTGESIPNSTVPDYQYFSNSDSYFPAVGGRWSNGTDAGLWCVGVYYSSTYTDSYIGGRLAKI